MTTRASDKLKEVLAKQGRDDLALRVYVTPGGCSGFSYGMTFAEGNEAFGKPSNPNFLLKPNELLDAVRGHLTVVAYEHGKIESPRAAVIQRIAAVRAAVGAVPPPSS